MNNLRRSNPALRHGKIGLMQILVGGAVLVVLIGVVATVMKSSKIKGNMAEATKKLQALGDELQGYANDHNGLLPLEDAPAKDDWLAAANPAAAEVWYNALPKRMGASPVAELKDNPSEFYQRTYPLFLPGAAYPKPEKRMGRPYFAFGMNSRLQRKGEDGTEQPANMATIERKEATVAFIERGVTKNEKTSKLQGGFDGAPKANASNFATRYNGKGLIVFVDGHVESYVLDELIDRTGRIIYPQTNLVWTPDPESNPN